MQLRSTRRRPWVVAADARSRATGRQESLRAGAQGSGNADPAWERRARLGAAQRAAAEQGAERDAEPGRAERQRAAAEQGAGRPDAALQGSTRSAAEPQDSAAPDPAARHVAVLIVGSGFAGLGAAIRLEQAGRPDFLVIERGGDVGGTWRDNTYPGAACDVPSHLYSFSFAPNPDWSTEYSPQPEIQQYLRRTAERSGTLERHVFDCEMLSAHWDVGAGEWVVETTRGTFTCTILVTAFGGLSEPRLPDIPGIEKFTGDVFHTARWNNGTDITGRRVAVIGTGASAIQLVPEIASAVHHLDIYQRTAPWIMPRRNRRTTPTQRALLRRVPAYRSLVRGFAYSRLEFTGLAFCYLPWALDIVARQAAGNLRRHIPDPTLRGRLTPDFRLGCKRILFSNDYYQALARDNVEVITTSIREITDSGIVTDDGAVRNIDTLIAATGFRTTDSPAADLIVGADGRTLGEQWRESGQEAYKGSAVSGFSNLFVLVGPNTGTGNMSMVYMIESQLNYLLDAAGCPAGNGPLSVGHRRGARRGAGPLQHHPAAADAQNSLGLRVYELVPGRAGPEQRHMAGIRRPFPVDHPPVRPACLPNHSARQRMSAFGGRVAVVTGAGSGIGQALAWQLAAQGATLAISDVDEPGLAETAARTSSLGSRVRCDRLDVVDRAAMLGYARSVAAEFGAVHLVINNAGVAHGGDFLGMSFADIERVVDVDFWGVVNGTKAFLPHLIASRHGTLVNISSLFGLVPMPGQSAYVAAKYAVRGFTEAVRIEMLAAGHPVQVTCVHPGGVRTSIARSGTVNAGADPVGNADYFDQKLARTSPDRAASLILRGAERGKPRVLIGADAWAVYLAGSLSSRAWQRTVAFVVARRARQGGTTSRAGTTSTK